MFLLKTYYECQADTHYRKKVIVTAKAYAIDKGQSLPEMVENHFKFVIVSRKKIKEKQLSHKVRKLREIVKTDLDMDYKKF
ncbi:DUF6364 family protein [Psychroflexus sp. CAK1W]|uniref:DUF6364 family protein n=1 Tax=Psychroflexus curvus TaxID=2873595 RepID=UPI001CCFC730|nr:DUF6364 family protein [Psychroflexus curvus]MBZ9627023.1 DUF6364 family protein [Psychroflexus curvus]